MKFCIAGKNEIAVKGLQYLLELGIPRNQILACVNKNDDGINGWQPSYLSFCNFHNIEVVDLNVLYPIADLIFFSLEFDKIINPKLFVSTQLFNIHFSKLPQYKGMFTSVMPILHGESESGVTLHKIDSGIDTGDIIKQKVFDITHDMNAFDLYNSYLWYGYKLFVEEFIPICHGKFNSYPQPALKSTYYSKKAIDFKKLIIDFNKTSFEVDNQIRAFSFRPYQLPFVNGYPISHSKILESKSYDKVGTIVFEDDLSLIVTTIDYKIVLYKDKNEEILKAASEGDINQLLAYKSKGYRLYEKNHLGWDTLIVAAFNEQVETCKWLLSEGLNPNSKNYNGTSVLMFAMTAATKSSNLETLKLLIESGSNVNHVDYRGISLLEYAQKGGNTLVINYLKEFLG